MRTKIQHILAFALTGLLYASGLLLPVMAQSPAGVQADTSGGVPLLGVAQSPAGVQADTSGGVPLLGVAQSPAGAAGTEERSLIARLDSVAEMRIDTVDARWLLVADGEALPIDGRVTAGPETLAVAARETLDELQRLGHYFASVDSVTVDAASVPPVVRIFATPGPQVHVGRLRLIGAARADSAAILAMMDTRPGRVLDRQRLEADLDAILTYYERAGHPLAEVHLEEVRLEGGDEPVLDLVVRVEQGRTLRLHSIEIVGGRTRASFVGRLAGLRPGSPLETYDPEAIRRRLMQTAFFREVGVPELRIAPDSGAVLRIPIEEEDPGTFDLVLGYLPAGSGGGAGTVIGSGHIEMQNLFGAGRSLSLRLNRLPGHVSSVESRLSDPFVFGLPLRVAAEFSGLQQDSTYSQHRYLGEIGIRVNAVLEAFASYSREATRPGQAGMSLVGGRQRIPRADAWFAGVGLRMKRLDRSVNPTRGFVLETRLEQGRKERTLQTAVPDTTTSRASDGQSRFRFDGRLYLPTLHRQVAVVGGQASLVLTPQADESDLYRIGGARSLRGYDEDRFVGRTTGRLFAEYRLQLDRLSYVYSFFDLGFVEKPALPDSPAQSGLHPGYGVGIQFSTNIGIVNVSAALNPEDGPTGARIHAGLAFGL